MSLVVPDYLGIGAPRTGSRWLCQCLSEHPDLSIVDHEVSFFTTRRVIHPNWHKGVEWYSDILREAKTPGTLIGEITPVYLFDGDTAEKISSVAPNVKLICCLRDQLDRAFSAYRLVLHHSPLLTPKSYPFKKFLTYCGDIYGIEGFYLEHIERFLKFFSREQLLILVYDDLKKTPEFFLNQVYQFLNVDAEFQAPSLINKINDMPVGSSPKFHDQNTGLKNTIKRMKREIKTKLNSLRQPTLKNAEKQGFLITDEIREMMHVLYHDHNIKLGKMLGRDLSHWNRVGNKNLRDSSR